MSFDIISILFVSLCYNSKSLGLMNNPKEWMMVINNNSNKMNIQTNQSKQIHGLMNICRTIKCCNNDKIHDSSNILPDDKRNYIDEDMNLLFRSKNIISLLHNLMRKKRQLNKHYGTLRGLSRNLMNTNEKKISWRRDTQKEEDTNENNDTKSQGANEEAAIDKEVQQEVNKSDDEVKGDVDVPNEEKEIKDDSEKNDEDDTEKGGSSTTAYTSNNKHKSASVTSTFGLKKSRDGTTHIEAVDNKKNSHEKVVAVDSNRRDVDKFISKLDSILSSSGDYIIALMMNNYKYRMRTNHMNEKFWGKVQEMANKSGGDLYKAKHNLEKQIQTKFGNEFINEVANSLRTLAHDVNLPS